VREQSHPARTLTDDALVQHGGIDEKPKNVADIWHQNRTWCVRGQQRRVLGRTLRILSDDQAASKAQRKSDFTWLACCLIKTSFQHLAVNDRPQTPPQPPIMLG